MTNFFEIDEIKKTHKTLNLDDFSMEDLQKYIEELNIEVERVTKEMERKRNFKKNAEKIFR